MCIIPYRANVVGTLTVEARQGFTVLFFFVSRKKWELNLKSNKKHIY